tara:strand:+ start:1090 stop:1320 length:231 start_codon:yes stop_codon:yes gene_type:complete
MYNEFVKVKDHPNLKRDPLSNGIINTNQSDYDEYIARREAANKAKKSEVSMKEDLDNLKGEINEIKSLLKELVNGN